MCTQTLNYIPNYVPNFGGAVVRAPLKFANRFATTLKPYQISYPIPVVAFGTKFGKVLGR